MHIYQTPLTQLFESFNSTENGLSDDQVTRHLKTYGRNTLSIVGSPWWKKLLAPFLNLFMLILAAAATISIITHEVLDGVIIIIIMLVTAIISYIQEASSERIFNALRKVDIQQVLVWRNGKLIKVSSELVVPGDVVELREGQKVPADARLLTANSIRVDESLLTGESKPVAKLSEAIESEVPVYEQKNMLFSGSSIIAGEGKALIVATGNTTEFGKLAELSGSQHLETSPVQKKIAKLIGQITVAVAIVSVVIFSLSLYRGMELSEAVRFVLALGVASIPESLPVSISVVLVLAARMLAKQKALVRNLSAIENIGIITTIATDKTGTLTKNQLKVHADWKVDANASLTLGLITQLSVNQHTANGATHDPLDTALDQFSSDQSTSAYMHATSYPFNQALAMSGNAWREKDDSWRFAIKGSPESLIARCKLSKSATTLIEEQIHAYTTQGFRVIAVATGSTNSKPNKQLEKSLPENMEFVGLLAVADELREEASQAIATTLAAGVDVRMITGDHFETAFAIGRQLGLVKQREQVFDCRQMASLSDQDLESVVESTKVFSRVLPEYKHRILTLLKKSHIVAMTGDGVNDVPALTNAHIGIAMGSGSQVAKEAGDIVLLDNNFASIVAALRQGRVVFDNIQRMVFYLLSTNAGEILTMVGALIMGIPVPLLPVQILWINIVTDTTMEIPLGLQPAEHEVLQRPPRHPNKPILGRGIVIRMIAIALTMAIVSLGTFIFFWQGHHTDYARTATFNALVVMQWANAFNARREWESSIFNRSLFRSKLFYIALISSIIIQGVAILTPLRSFLGFVKIEAIDIALPGIIGIISILAVGELHKLIGRRWYGK